MQTQQDQQWQRGDWEYSWNANGSLRSVKLPDGEIVAFEYDALGRRTKKIFNNKIIRYLWDNNVLLHEWEYDKTEAPRRVVNKLGEVSLDKPEPVNNLITWVYETGSFVPCAKIVGNETFSIINDYIGRPIQAYDNNGNLIWSCDYDIYGNLRNLKGERDFIPFRQLGQYEDIETGLYYNRFRYYNPETGLYISKDPISILGGLNVYAYVKDVNKFVDILGLITYNTMPSIPNYQKHHIIPKQLSEHSVIQKAEFNIHNSSNIIYLPKKADIDTNPSLAIHNGPHPEYTSKVLMDLDEILNRSSIDLKKGNIWTKEQYNIEIEKTINKYKELLINGKIQCK